MRTMSFTFFSYGSMAYTENSLHIFYPINELPNIPPLKLGRTTIFQKFKISWSIGPFWLLLGNLFSILVVLDVSCFIHNFYNIYWFLLWVDSFGEIFTGTFVVSQSFFFFIFSIKFLIGCKLLSKSWWILEEASTTLLWSMQLKLRF